MNWQSKPAILVTGGAGYLGGKLIRDLADDPHFADHTIRIYDNLYRQDLNSLMDLPVSQRYVFIEGDILDQVNLLRAMKGVSMVLHLAALVRTPLHFDNPAWIEQVNHWGTASVVQCALRAGVRRLVYASTTGVYGSGGPFDESDPCRPISPYTIAKHRGEGEVLHGVERGLEAVVVRLGMIFGNAPAMRFDGVTNRFAFLAGAGRLLTIHGSGEQVRPLIHVDDASAALRLCAREAESGAIINAAAMNVSINQIAEIMQAIAPSTRTHYTDQGMVDRVSFAVNTAKLHGLGFSPRVDLSGGLRTMLARWKPVSALD